MNEVVWTGFVDGVRTRIVRTDVDDGFVETSDKSGVWAACGDEHAMHTFAAAFFETFRTS